MTVVTTTWDSSKNRGFNLTNNLLTATGNPTNGTNGAIVYVWATTALVANQKTYFEVKVDKAAVETAAIVGIGKYISSGDYTTRGRLKPDPTQDPNPTDALMWGYNDGVTSDGYALWDPQNLWENDPLKATVIWGGNGQLAYSGGPRNSQGPTVVGVLVDFVNNQITLINGADNSSRGPFHITGLAGHTVYPVVRNWDIPGFVAIINGGTNGFALGLPSGYTPLDGTSGGGGGGGGGGGTFQNYNIRMWGGYIPGKNGNYNWGGGTDSDTDAGVVLFEGYLGHQITMVNTFPCGGWQDKANNNAFHSGMENPPYSKHPSWGGQIRATLTSMKASPYGRRIMPIHGLFMFQVGLPDNFGDNNNSLRSGYTNGYTAIAGGQYDPMFIDMVKAHSDIGLGTAIFRLRYEFNGGWNPDSSTDGAKQYDKQGNEIPSDNFHVLPLFVSCFEHVSNVLYAAGKTYGVKVIIIFNPATNFYPVAKDLISASYYDWIGIDFYNGCYGATAAQLADDSYRIAHWDTGSPLNSFGMQSFVNWSTALKTAGTPKPAIICESGADWPLTASNTAGVVPNDPMYIPYMAGKIALLRANAPFYGQLMWDIYAGDGNHTYTTVYDKTGVLNSLFLQQTVLDDIVKYTQPSMGTQDLTGDIISLPQPVFRPDLLDSYGTGGATITVTVTKPSNVVNGSQTISGNVSSPSATVSLAWAKGITGGTAPTTGVSATVNVTTGNFTATVDIDPVNVAGGMWYSVNSGSFTLAWLSTPVASGSPTVTATVTQPTSLVSGASTITGTVSSSLATVRLCWRSNTSTPLVTDSDVVVATVATNGTFSATVTIGVAGTQGTMWYSLNGNNFISAWTATPIAAASVTVTQPSPLVAQSQTISGSYTGAVTSVSLVWVSDGSTPTSGTAATLNTSALTFSAVVSIGPAGTAGKMWYSNSGAAFVVAWSGTPGTPGQQPPTVTVTQPNPLVAGNDTISGTVTVTTPAATVALCWRTTGQPLVTDSDVVQATVNATTGAFSAVLVIDHPGTQSTMWSFVNGGATPTKQWSATPVTKTITATVNQPSPLLAGSQSITGTLSAATARIVLAWATGSTVPTSGVSATVNSTTGAFAATLDLDPAGTAGSMWYSISEATPFTKAWSGTPKSPITVTVNEPSVVTVGSQTITGSVTDPTATVALAWAVTGTTPTTGVSATVNGTTGAFSATVNITPVSTQGAMWYSVNSLAFQSAWTATPIPVSTTVTVNQPNPLIAGTQFITGTLSVATSTISLAWSTSGVPTSGTAATVNGTTGAFSGSVDIDPANTAGGLYYSVNGASPFVEAWTGTPQSSTPTITATVNEPTVLTVGSQTITGTVSDPTAKIALAWATSGTTPSSGTSATVNGTTGVFSGTVNVTPVNVLGAMWYSINSGAFQSAWTATPVAASITTTVNEPSPLVVGSQSITGVLSDPTATIVLAWSTSGVPTSGSSATVNGTTGNFTATVDIDPANTLGGMYYSVNSASPFVEAWTGTPAPVTPKVTATVNQPSPLVNGTQTITGSVSDPTATVLIAWSTSGQPTTGTSATVNTTTGTFSVSIDVDPVNVAGGMWSSVNSAAFLLAWSATPAQSGGGTPAPTATVNQPTNLTPGSQTITGSVSDPTATIKLAWVTNGSTPTSGVSATVNAATGAFSATVDIDPNATLGVMWYQINTTAFQSAWSGTPESPAPTTTINIPSPLLIGTQQITGTVNPASEPIWLAWANGNDPVPTSGTAATVNSTTGAFSCTVTLTSGLGIMYYSFDDFTFNSAWSGSPQSGSSPGPAIGATVYQPIGLIPGPFYITGQIDLPLGTPATAYQTVAISLCWRSDGTTPIVTDPDIISASINALTGQFNATVTIGAANVVGVMWYNINAGQFLKAWQAIPAPPGSTQPPVPTAFVYQPSQVVFGINYISGVVTDPAASVSVEWAVAGVTPAPGDTNIVPCVVIINGYFSASVNIGPANTTGALWYSLNGGAFIQAWTGDPINIVPPVQPNPVTPPSWSVPNTYGAMQTRIQYEVLGSPTLSDIQYAIQDAIAEYERETFWFNDMRTYGNVAGSQSNLATVQGQEFYSAVDLPALATAPHIRKMMVFAFNNRYPLTERTQQWIDDQSLSRTWYGLPTDWCWQANSIRLYPIPDGAYPLIYDGTIRFPPLVKATDYNCWTNEAEWLIRAEAKRLLFINVTRDSTQADAMELEILGNPRTGRQGALAQLRRESMRRAGGTGRMRPSPGFM